MNLFRIRMIPAIVLVVLLGSGAIFTSAAHGQTPISGDITGIVLDPTGAAVAGAKITAVNRQTGAAVATGTSSSGNYRFSLLVPGTYTLSAVADGFKASSVSVNVAVGQVVTQNIALAVGAASQTVRVTPASQLLDTDTAQFSTVLSFNEIQSIPNPGSDITYQAQARPGVVMNTASNSDSGILGYGNFSVFGLPGVSNTFTLNGMVLNDSFMNLNYSGPSNLLLGLNDIQETNVVANAYAAEYGGSGGIQLNSISRAGGNQFHGNLTYAWNGSSLNGNDWFFNHDGEARPFSNFNQWAAAAGGPIKKDKLFFFLNTEGISFITSSQNPVYFPNAAFESDPSYPTSGNVSVLGDSGNCPGDGSSSLANAGYASECAFYQKVFGLYNNAPTYKMATPTSTPGQLEFSAPAKFALTEQMITARVDANLGANDKAFGHFKYDHGLQPSYTDPINSAFNAQSDQSDFEGQFAETHTFGARAVNQFLMTGSWYAAIYSNVNPATEQNTLPFEMYWIDGFASNLNNEGELWPDGRDVTAYQLADDFSYTAGKHTLKAGFAFRKDDISDRDPGVLTTPVIYVDAYDFGAGISDLGAGDFPTRLNVPLSLYSLAFYAQDNWKPLSNLTLTPGVRLERNSNVVCRIGCMSNFGGNFFALAGSAPLNSASAPYNQQIKSNLLDAFPSYQPYMIEPRIGVTYSPDRKTVVRGGFGIFTDAFSAYTVDSLLNNPPTTLAFTLYGTPYYGPYDMALDPSDPTSAQSRMASAVATFANGSGAADGLGFSAGGSAAAMENNPNFAPPNFTTVAARLRYPTYDEWSLQLERQFGNSQSLEIGYVGNHGYHEPNENVGANAYGGPLAAAPPAPSFGEVNEIASEASSNYNGLIVTYLFQGHGLHAQLNYAWSHALDEISNGGELPFCSPSITNQINPLDLSQNYGNADYDVRHNFSGTYLYQIPGFGRMRAVTADWQVGGTIFYNSGFPFTPETYISNFGIYNYGTGSNVAPLAALPGTPHHCGASAAVQPCLSADEFPPTQPFGATDRNQFWGPHFFDTDMTLLKGFHLPKLGEQTRLEAGATAFNLFNHPNFGMANSLVDNGASIFGTSQYMDGPPTSIYGSGLGGNASVRILEITGKVIF